MNLLQLSRKYNTPDKCYKYLEKLRWGKKPICPYCDSKRTVKLNSEPHRFHCYDCHKSFSVTVGTIFEDSRLPLPNWFYVIALMTNAKMGIAAKEIQRNAGLTYKTAWYSAMRVRCAMLDNCHIELSNVVEMDEAYLGGKPRKRFKPCKKADQTIAASGIDENKPKRGRGTCKTPIVGIFERHGKIVLQVIEKLNFVNLLSMLKEYVNTDKATLITDEYRSYIKMDEYIEHFVIEHKKQYVRGSIHTNNIEGFWSILKNSIKGNNIHVSKKYLPFYLVQAQYNYNNRHYLGNLFEKFVKGALTIDKSDFMMNYKPIKPPKTLVYGKRNVKKRCKGVKRA